jgi:hypothetical protein
VVLLLGVVASQSWGATSPIQKRPNIIVIVADDLRWDALGFAGNRIVQTPNLDRLAATECNSASIS